MNEQIDESIPVLTEVIPTSDSKSISSKSKATEAHFPFVTANLSPAANNAPVSNSSKPINAAIAAAQEVLAQPTLFQSETESEIALDAAVEHTNSISAEDWKELELSVRENVLRQVLSRVDFVLEHRVSDSLAEVLQTAVDKLADEIRVGLRNSIEEVVTRALTQELSKIKASNRKP
nr:hypothetical protein [uncultured Undibacterium sp.]